MGKLIKIIIGAFSIFLWETVYSESRVASVGLSMSGKQSDPASLGLIASMVFLIAGICCLICASQKELDLIFRIVTVICYFVAGIICLSANSSVYKDLKVFGWVGIIIAVVFLVMFIFEVIIKMSKAYEDMNSKKVEEHPVTKEEVKGSVKEESEEVPVKEVDKKESSVG